MTTTNDTHDNIAQGQAQGQGVPTRGSQPQLNLTTLCNALQSSFSANKAERDQAESALKSINCLPNACPLLLHIITSRTDVPEPIRSAAAIYLKNITKVRKGKESKERKYNIYNLRKI